MSLRSSRAALTALAAAGLLVATAGAASAETVASKDATGDTWHDDVSTGTDVYTPAGSTVNTDLVRTVVKHTATSVVVRGTFAELTKTGRNTIFYVRLRTNEGLRRDTGVDTLSSNAGTQHFTKPNGDSNLPCKGLTHSVDYVANQMTVTIPRACLSKPRWVQFVSGAASISADGDAVVDNGQDATSNDPTSPAHWSPRIHRA